LGRVRRRGEEKAIREGKGGPFQRRTPRGSGGD